MTTKVQINVIDTDLDYIHCAWEPARMILKDVNDILKERGIDLEFEIESHGECDESGDDIDFSEPSSYIKYIEE